MHNNDKEGVRSTKQNCSSLTLICRRGFYRLFLGAFALTILWTPLTGWELDLNDWVQGYQASPNSDFPIPVVVGRRLRICICICVRSGSGARNRFRFHPWLALPQNDSWTNDNHAKTLKMFTKYVKKNMKKFILIKTILEFKIYFFLVQKHENFSSDMTIMCDSLSTLPAGWTRAPQEHPTRPVLNVVPLAQFSYQMIDYGV